MDRNGHGYGGPGWSQGPGDPIYQRHAPQSHYDSYFGDHYDKFGIEDSWRSHPSDSWREDRLNRAGDLPPRYDDQLHEYHGWRRSISPERTRVFPKDQFTYVRPQEPKMARSEAYPKPRGRGRHRRSVDRPPREKDAIKGKLDDNGDETKEMVKGIAEADAEKDSDENNEKKKCDDLEEKECQNNTAKKEENCEQQHQTDVAVKEELSDEKPADIKSSEQNEKKEANGSKGGEDPSKKLIIRKDFTHDDIHHFKPISIRDPEEKPKIKRHREPGWVTQWEMKNAALKESTSRSGTGSKSNSISGEPESQRIRKDSVNESDDKQAQKANPILHGPVLDPEQYVEELSNPDLTDPPQVEDLASELMPKRKKTASSTEEDWRPGAKTTLLGPPPEVRRGKAPEVHRPHKPGLLGRPPPPKPYYEEVGPRRPPKPGLLDGPRREHAAPVPRPHPYNEEYFPPVPRMRNGPAAPSSNEMLQDSFVTMAAASLTGSDVISEVAKKGIAELLLSSDAIKAKITELYSEEIKKMLKGVKSEESPSASRVLEKGTREMPFNAGPRAGKALLGAPPARRRDGPAGQPDVLPVNGPTARPDDINRIRYFNRSPDDQWKESYERPRAGFFDNPSEYYREGPSQDWRDGPHGGDPREIRQQYPSEREHYVGPGPEAPWDEYHGGERGSSRDWGRERRDPREYEDYLATYGKGSSFLRDPYTNNATETRRVYGLNERHEEREWEYGESGFGPAGKGTFDVPRDAYAERRH